MRSASPARAPVPLRDGARDRSHTSSHVAAGSGRERWVGVGVDAPATREGRVAPERSALASGPTPVSAPGSTTTCRIIASTMTMLDSIRRICTAMVVVLTCAAASGCRGVNATVLERRDVLNFTATPLDVQGVRLLRVAGLAMHSALTVQRVETLSEDGVVRVRVMMALARKDQSGSFDLVVLVPATVTKVEFGDERAVVWPPP